MVVTNSGVSMRRTHYSPQWVDKDASGNLTSNFTSGPPLPSPPKTRKDPTQQLIDDLDREDSALERRFMPASPASLPRIDDGATVDHFPPPPGRDIPPSRESEASAYTASTNGPSRRGVHPTELRGARRSAAPTRVSKNRYQFNQDPSQQHLSPPQTHRLGTSHSDRGARGGRTDPFEGGALTDRRPVTTSSGP